MDGVVQQVNVGGGGVPKRAVASARVTRTGLAGDRQAKPRIHGGAFMAVCLFDAETLEVLAAEGYAVGPGSLGENLTTRGVDYRSIRVGDVHRVGDDVLLQVTKPRGPCTTIQVHGDGILKRLWGPTVPWGESGFYARVVAEGEVRAGDVVALERPGRDPPPPFTARRLLPEDAFA